VDLDMRQIAAAALEAAFEEDGGPQQGEPPQSRHSVAWAIAAGVILGGATRIALAKASTIRELRDGPKMTNVFREAPERLRETVADGFVDVLERIGGVESG
jgi:hypothetical protein